MNLRSWICATSFLALAACSSSPETTGATSSVSSSAQASSSAASSGAGGSTTSSTGAGGAGTGGMGGAGGKIDKAKDCTGTFGTALTSAFGRIDGTVLAVVKPTDTTCPLPNNDHVILEVVMKGDAYRMVINVKSSFGNPEVFFLEKAAPLPAPAWSEGWHPGLTLDYVKDMGLKSTDFMSYPQDALSNKIADAITLGQKVSVYATSSGGNSAHLIHRQDGKADGMIVLDPDVKTSRAMTFHFGEQVF